MVTAPPRSSGSPRSGRGTRAGARGLLLAALATIVAPGVRPSAAQGDGAPFGESVDVRVVNVEVIVTGRDGAPIGGLLPADFRLLVDGKEVAIDFFSELREGRAVARPSGAGDRSAGPGPALEPEGEDSRVGTHYLVFLDESSLIAADRDRLLARLDAQARALREGDRLAVIAFDGKEVTRIQDWSGDPLVLASGLARAARRPSRGVAVLAELRRLRNTDARRRVFRSSGAIASQPGQSRYEQYLVDGTQLTSDEIEAAWKVVDRLEAMVAAAAATLRSLPAPRGRKVLLVLAGDLPFAVGQYVAGFSGGSAERVITDSRLPTGEELYSPLVETANLLGYTIYPVDVGGVTTQVASVEEVRALEPVESAALFDSENDVHFGLLHLAEETGGKAILNTANVEALERVALDTASYYWLGFYAQRAGDDAEHDIRVEVSRPGARVRARKGFVDVSPATELDFAVEGALLLGPDGIAEPLGIEVGTPRRKPGDRQQMVVPLTLVVPASAVRFEPREGGGAWAAQLDLRLAAVDRQGGRADPIRAPVTLTIPAAPGPTTRVRYSIDVELRRLDQSVAVLLHDAATFRTLAGRVEVAAR